MNENYWEKFVDHLLERVGVALDKGEASRLSAGGTHQITIDIYASKGQMKAFNEAVMDVAKAQRGMGVAKPESEKAIEGIDLRAELTEARNALIREGMEVNALRARLAEADELIEWLPRMDHWTVAISNAIKGKARAYLAKYRKGEGE